MLASRAEAQQPSVAVTVLVFWLLASSSQCGTVTEVLLSRQSFQLALLTLARTDSLS